jgi:hypothetical protein
MNDEITKDIDLAYDLNNIRHELTLSLKRGRNSLELIDNLFNQAEYAVAEIDSVLAKIDITISKIEEPII